MDWLGISPSLVLDAEQHLVVMVVYLGHWMSGLFHIAIALVCLWHPELAFDM